MFELNQLEVLVAVVEEGTISKAADKLLISQPALSRTIQHLEDELGIKLFDRTKNKIFLNENGQLAYTLAKNLLNQAYSLKDELLSFDRLNYTIIVGSCAPSPIWALEEIINTKIESEIIDNSNDLIDGLLKNKYSMIILDHYIENNNFELLEMYDESLYIATVPSHPLSRLESISFNELDGQSILLSQKIGFWNSLCKLNLPNSKLLYQDDDIYNEVVDNSTLPSFRTDITIKKNNKDNNRIFVPISDDEAKVTYYLYFKKEHKDRYSYIKGRLKQIEWI